MPGENEELLTTDAAEGADATADAAAGAAEAQKTEAAEAKTLAAEVKALKAQVAEKDDAVRYWHGEAKKGAKAEPKADEPDEDEKIDLLDVIGTKGTKGLTAVLRKAGFVSAAEVDQKVEQRTAQVVRESKLVQEFPELSDDKSEFFKATAVEFGKLQRDGMPKAIAMEQAARNVRLAEYEAGTATPAAKTKDPEAERQRRIKAQGGDRGTRRSGTEDSDALSDDQKTILAGMRVSEKDFREQTQAMKARR